MKRHLSKFESFDPEGETDQERERRLRKQARMKGMKGMFGPKLTPEQRLEDIEANIGPVYEVSCVAGGGSSMIGAAIGEDEAEAIGMAFYEDLLNCEIIENRGANPPDPETIYMVNGTEWDFLQTLSFYVDSVEATLEELEEYGSVTFYGTEMIYDAAERIVDSLEYGEDENEDE